MEKKYFNQLISEEKTAEIITNRKNIVLTGGTGTGKTSYILERVCKAAEKVLYYVPRTALLQDIKDDAQINRIYNIEVETIQSFCTQVKNNSHNIEIIDQKYLDIICQYDVVVFDEVHTIFTDATFNSYTDYTYELLKALLESDDITVIMISATGRCIFNDLKSKHLISDNDIYNIRTDYSYLTATPLRTTKNCIPDKISELFETTSPDDKILYFTSNIKKSIELKKELEKKYNFKITFACSKNHASYKKINEIEEVRRGTFPGKLLICTTALDVGISLKDSKIKYIVTDIYNIESFIQSIGRRRVQQGEKIQLYFKNWKSQLLNGMIGKANKELNQIEFFKTDNDKFLISYERNHRNLSNYIFYHQKENIWKYNEVGEIILKYNLEEYELIRKQGLSNCIKKECYNINITDEEDTEKNNPTDTRFKLFELVNRKIYMNDKDLLVDAVALVEDKAKCRRKSRDYKTLKEHISYHYKLDLIKEEDKRLRKTYWILRQTEETFDYAKDNETIERNKWEKVFQRNIS